MKQVKVSFQQGMEVGKKVEAIVEIKTLGVGRIQFDFKAHPDSVLCVLEDETTILELEKLSQVLKVEKIR